MEERWGQHLLWGNKHIFLGCSTPRGHPDFLSFKKGGEKKNHSDSIDLNDAKHYDSDEF